MRTRTPRTSGSSGGSSSSASSPGKRSLTGTVRRKAKADAAGDGGGASSAFKDATSGAGSQIPYRSEMEGAFGEDFGGVRSHVGQGEAMDSLGAHAAASGEDVAFGSASPDKETVAHELTHVVQDRRGSGGVHGKDGLTDASDSAEVEADRVAGAVVAGERVEVAGGASPGVHLARKAWAERRADLLAAIDARILQITPAAVPAATPPDAAAAPPDVAPAPPGAAPPGAAPAPPDAAPVAPDPGLITVAELQNLRATVAAATDDATMDAAAATGVTLFSTKKPAERERFDGWVRSFGGVEGGAEMDTFLQMTDGQAASIMADTSVGGLAHQMLMGTFEGNWFKAKECLVFWRWPGNEPVFSRATGLEIMSALTKLRGNVHTEVQALTQTAIQGEVAKTAEKQRAVNPTLAATMQREAAPQEPGAPARPAAVEFKGSVGADTVTSDVDVSTGGINTEVAVRVYNEQFRTLMQTAFDPGTVFDLNVYSKDFIFKPVIAEATAEAPKTITPTTENPTAQPTEAQTEAQDNEQDIWAMVHVARYMPSKDEWDGYVAQVLAGITNVAERDRQEIILSTAWDRFQVFSRKLAQAMDALKPIVDRGILELGESSWGADEAKHFDEGALRMRAANKLYEQGLMKVKDIRAQIEACGPTESEKKGRLAAELTGAISSAQLYANEVYGSRGGTVHAVVGVQMARKLGAQAVMPPALWHETFNDNLGDVLKDYQHYGHAVGDHEPDFGYAAFKMGKYADRMIDAVPHLGEGGEAAYMGPADLEAVQASPEFGALAELSQNHVTAKSGPASNNPALLADDAYFSGFDAGSLATYKDYAITLGADVRARVAQHRSTPPPGAAQDGAAQDGAAQDGAAPVDAAAPEAAQQPAAPDAAQQQEPAGLDPRPVLGAMHGTVRAAVARIEADIAKGPTQLKADGAAAEPKEEGAAAEPKADAAAPDAAAAKTDAPDAAPKQDAPDAANAEAADAAAPVAAPKAAAPTVPASGGKPLPEDVRLAMEDSLGADFSHVRIHESPVAAEVGARAFTQGTDIVFAPGQYNPESSAGKELLAHELTHVVQQGAGRVAAQPPKPEAKADQTSEPQAKASSSILAGSQINADASLEAEADAAGALAARGEPATIAGATSAPGVQRDATGPVGQGPNTVHAGAATAATVPRQDYPTIGASKVSDFIRYVDSAADWSMSIPDSAHQSELRTLLTWLRAGDHRRTSFAEFTVSQVIAVKADLAKLDAYARANMDRGTVKINAGATMAECVSIGTDVLKLEAVCQGPVLHQIFTADYFDQLRTATKVDQFCTYVRNCAPLLHAHDGDEIDSFLLLAKSADPSSFRDIRDVRNYHRFQEPALAGLRANQGGNPGNKPLTLILHTALDYNGAFHHDPELTAVIGNTTNHVIMIEGADSLDAISGRIPDILALHGRSEPDPADASKMVKRIDQLMICGHGTAKSIELAGTLKTDADGNAETNNRGNLRVNDDDLDVTHDPANPVVAAREQRSRDFMQSLMALMSQDPTSPHRRVVFNACLTAANEIDPDAIDASASPDDQAAQMNTALADSPSITNTMREMAPTGGAPIDVRGGNGSFAQVGLIDGTGALDIVADGTNPDGDPYDRTLDPELTNPDKLVYVEQGTDPDGCLSACAERWAADRTTLIPAIQRRRAAPKGGSWKETIIQAMYEIIETRYAESGANIAMLANVVFGFEELISSRAHPRSIGRMNADEDWGILHTHLSAHGAWAAAPQAAVAFLGAWCQDNGGKIPDFLTAVGAMTVKDLRPHLQMSDLKAAWGSFVPASAANPPHPGQLRLALRDLADNEEAADPVTRSYLSSLVTANAFTFDINPALTGMGDSDWALMVLGLHPSQVGGASAPVADPAAPPPDANVDMNVSGINESLVEPLSVDGRVLVSTALHVRDQASLNGRSHSTMLSNGDQVYIMGQTGDWYLIDHGGKRGYASKTFIEELASDAAGATITAPVAAPTAEPVHPTAMRTDDIVTELANPALDADRRTALEAELRNRRLIVSVTCITKSDGEWGNDEIHVRASNGSGSAVSLERTGFNAGQTHAFSVPIAALLPLGPSLTIDVLEEDVTATQTVATGVFVTAAGVAAGATPEYVFSAFYEGQLGA